MKRLMIASDIHGSIYYCKKMVEAFEREKADRLILLGDILYHGPRNDLPREYEPKQVIELLNQYKDKIICVRGNCDTEVDQMVLEFPMLADYSVILIDDLFIFATHGHKYNCMNLPPHKKGDILLHGHTHVPAHVISHEECNDMIYINPGSVTIPKNNTENSYILYEDRCFIFKNLDGMVFDKFQL